MYVVYEDSWQNSFLLLLAGAVHLERVMLAIMIRVKVHRETVDCVHITYSSQTFVLCLFADKSFGKGATK